MNYNEDVHPFEMNHDADYYYCYYYSIPIEYLLGRVFVSVEQEDDTIVFTLDNGDKFKLEHHQDCCESVYIESIIGDLLDLEN